MKKIIMGLFLIFLIVGCGSSTISNTISYNLDISDSYNERISIALPKNAYEIAKNNSPFVGQSVSYEYALLYGDIHPITTSSDIVYKKEVKDFDDSINVQLDYNYPEKDFLNETYIYKCFENYDINGTDDYFEISLSGKYFCLSSFDKLVINVTNSNYILESNGVKTKKGYTWTINKNNYNNVDIYYKFSRAYSNMATSVSNDKNKNIFKRVFSIITLMVLVIAIIFWFKARKKYKYLYMPK